MTQVANYVIEDVDGATFLVDINAILQAIATANAGATEPSTTYAYMPWLDTTTPALKLRNGANDGWITIGDPTLANLGLLAKSGGNMTGAINDAITTVSSAATPDIWTSTGKFIDYTGTVTATGFAAAPQAGASRTLILAAAAPFTAGANMLIDGYSSGQTMTLAAGDRVEVIALTTTKFRLRAVKANGSSISTTGVHGKCQLTKSSTNLLLSQYDGQTVIDGAGNILTVPSAGITLAPTSLASSTFYYIYGYDNNADGVLDTLEASTTSYTTASNGVKHKTGATGMVLVGCARTTAATAWADSATQRFVRSLFNERRLLLQNNLGSSDSSTTSTSYVALSTSLLRVEYIAWEGESVYISAGGRVSINTDSVNVFSTIYKDGSATNGEFSHNRAGLSQLTSHGHALTHASSNTEGYHYVDVYGKVDGGTGTWLGGANNNNRFHIEGIIN